MDWQEISIATTEIMEEAVTNLFYDIGAAGVVIEDPKLLERYVQSDCWDAYDISQELLDAEYVVVKGYLPVDEKLPLMLEQLNGAIAALSAFFEDYHAQIKLSRLEEDDWANSWKEYYKPQRISDKIVVVPSWEKYEKSADELIISLDPGMAFGTGGHPTTMMCIKAIEKHIKPNAVVADIGTGSGIISIAAAKLGAKSVKAIDLDTLAVKIADVNAKKNNVENIVQVSEGNLLDNIGDEFDIVVANIIADVIIEMSQDVFSKLNENGIFIAAGIIEEKLNQVIDKLKNTGFSIIEVMSDNAWRGIVAVKG